MTPVERARYNRAVVQRITASPEKSAAPVCAQCGRPLPPAARFCPACGARAETLPPPQTVIEVIEGDTTGTASPGTGGTSGMEPDFAIITTAQPPMRSDFTLSDLLTRSNILFAIAFVVFSVSTFIPFGEITGGLKYNHGRPVSMPFIHWMLYLASAGFLVADFAWPVYGIRKKWYLHIFYIEMLVCLVITGFYHFRVLNIILMGMYTFGVHRLLSDRLDTLRDDSLWKIAGCVTAVNIFAVSILAKGAVMIDASPRAGFFFNLLAALLLLAAFFSRYSDQLPLLATHPAYDIHDETDSDPSVGPDPEN